MRQLLAATGGRASSTSTSSPTPATSTRSAASRTTRATSSSRATSATARWSAGCSREHRPRAVVNFAAETHVDRSIDGPGAFLETNVVGTFELLDGGAALLAGARRPASGARFRFLHVSTDEVYGSLGPDGRVHRDDALRPALALLGVARPPPTTSSAPTTTPTACRRWSTNCSNNYGPYQFPEKLIPLMILNALEGKPLPVYGDGQNVRDWLYVEDHCPGDPRGAGRRARPGETYNIGGDSERTNLEVVEAICDAGGRAAARACRTPRAGR